MVDARFCTSASLLHNVNGENHNSITSTDCKYSDFYRLLLRGVANLPCTCSRKALWFFILNLCSVLSNTRKRRVRKGAMFVVQSTFSVLILSV